jgi:crossover junction endodeoxyribonuclease RuvC
MTRILGCDPGKTGAFAVIDTTSPVSLVDDIVDIPDTEAMIAKIISERLPVDLAVVELVHAMPKQGVTSTFTFGMGFGVIKGVLAAYQVPVRFVTPQEWKKGLKLTKDKASSRQRASELFPEWAGWFSRVRDDGRAEAALIAYCGLHQPTSGMAPVHANRKAADINSGGLV